MILYDSIKVLAKGICLFKYIPTNFEANEFHGYNKAVNIL